MCNHNKQNEMKFKTLLVKLDSNKTLIFFIKLVVNCVTNYNMINYKFLLSTTHNMVSSSQMNLKNFLFNNSFITS